MADGWEVLEVVGTEEEAELIAGYLRSREIDCVVESMHSHEFPVNVTKLSEVRVEVPVDQLDAARELLEKREIQDVDSSPWELGQLDGEE
jgi:hypothetical protein